MTYWHALAFVSGFGAGLFAGLCVGRAALRQVGRVYQRRIMEARLWAEKKR